MLISNTILSRINFQIIQYSKEKKMDVLSLGWATLMTVLHFHYH